MSSLGGIGPRSKRTAFSFIAEFKRFALKGNLIDMAVAVIIGGAFARLLDSLVKNVIMPVISLGMPADEGYLEWEIVLGEKTIPYGLFIGDVVSFFLIALTLFIFMVKILGWFNRSRKEEAVSPAPLSKDQELLMEIRDLLRERSPQRPAPES